MPAPVIASGKMYDARTLIMDYIEDAKEGEYLSTDEIFLELDAARVPAPEYRQVTPEPEPLLSIADQQIKVHLIGVFINPIRVIIERERSDGTKAYHDAAVGHDGVVPNNGLLPSLITVEIPKDLSTHPPASMDFTRYDIEHLMQLMRMARSGVLGKIKVWGALERRFGELKTHLVSRMGKEVTPATQVPFLGSDLWNQYSDSEDEVPGSSDESEED
jgi:hypothetical protein